MILASHHAASHRVRCVSLSHLGIWRRKKPEQLNVPSSLTHSKPCKGDEIPTMPGNSRSFLRMRIPSCNRRKQRGTIKAERSALLNMLLVVVLFHDNNHEDVDGSCVMCTRETRTIIRGCYDCVLVCCCRFLSRRPYPIQSGQTCHHNFWMLSVQHASCHNSFPRLIGGVISV